MNDPPNRLVFCLHKRITRRIEFLLPLQVRQTDHEEVLQRLASSFGHKPSSSSSRTARRDQITRKVPSAPLFRTTQRSWPGPTRRRYIADPLPPPRPASQTHPPHTPLRISPPRRLPVTSLLSGRVRTLLPASSPGSVRGGTLVRRGRRSRPVGKRGW